MANPYMKRAQKLAGKAEGAVRQATTPLRNFGFPFRAPTVPRGVEVPPEVSGLGAHYDTDWARRPLASSVRGVIIEGPMRLAARILTNPEVTGVDRLASLQRLEAPPSVIFAPTHHSHLDTGLMIRSIPLVWRRDLVVAAAADYFFNKKWKAVISALALNAVPIDREVTGRKSSDLLVGLVEKGSSLIIYPEGGRSPDGWGQEFKGGAAYLSSKTGAPVVPVFVDGTGSIFGKGMKRPRPGSTKVVFGAPMWPAQGESTRRFSARIEAEATVLGDEALTDYWSARSRAARGQSPSLTGPEHTSWRRDWDLADRRKLGAAGKRRRAKRSWPDLG
jgi:1-acyl-sn-glycerol-3-phosphate acyltransferase